MRLVSRRRALLTCLLAGVVTPPARSATGEPLPTAVLAALERAKVPRTALCVVVQEAGSPVERLAWNAARAVNPASLMKL